MPLLGSSRHVLQWGKIFSGAIVSCCAERLRVNIQRRPTAVNEGRAAHGVLA